MGEEATSRNEGITRQHKFWLEGRSSGCLGQVQRRKGACDWLSSPSSRGSLEAAGEGSLRVISNRWISQFVECSAQIFQDVTREERFFALTFLENCQLCGAPTGPGAHSTAIVKRQLSAGQAGANSGQHIAHSTTGHSRISCGVVADWLPPFTNNGAASFQQQGDRESVAKIPSDSGPRHFANFHQSSHFSRMRGEQARTAATSKSIDLIGDNVQAVGIDDHRLLRVFD